MKRLITLAAEAIYSEQFDFEAIVRRLAGTDEKTVLFRAYLAIEIATQLTEPLTQADVDHADEAVHSTEQHATEPGFDSILALRKELAEICWLGKAHEIIKRKIAYKINSYSYEATVYLVEKERKGPTTSQEREKYRKLSAQIEESEKQLEDHLDQQAAEKAADKAIQSMIDKIEREKRNGREEEN